EEGAEYIRGVLHDCTPAELAQMELNLREEERTAAEQAERHKAADELEARQQAKIDWIQNELLPQLKDQLEIENKKSRIDDQRRADWADFVKFAKKQELPALPAAPELICAFLLETFDEQDTPKSIRYYDAIVAHHLARNVDQQPWFDVWCRALMNILRPAAN